MITLLDRPDGQDHPPRRSAAPMRFFVLNWTFTMP
jgi:hypothetical protein